MNFFDVLLAFFERSPWSVIIDLTVMGGWTIFSWGILYALFWYLMVYKANKYTKDWNFILLAIDIPQLNVQTPLAVEQLFTHIFSVMEPPSIGYVYRRGFTQEYYSFEIVSIEGYIQFIIRVRDRYRDVVEAAVYAQYPEAEITEVEDYVNDVPDKYPNDTHQIFASDFAYIEHWANPIRVYREFEHSISKDTVLKDPMGTFLESFTRIGPGEQIWFQIIIEPIEEKRWKKEAIKQIEKAIGAKSKSKKGIFSFLGDNAVSKELGKALSELNAQITGAAAGEGSASADEGPPNQILYLTPGQKAQVENMEKKLGKLGYKTKLRVVYVALKDRYNPSRAMNSIVGAMNQYTIPSSNALLPKYLTSTQYAFAARRKEYRRRSLMRAYKARNMYAGKKPYIMSIEELATIWHFPMSHVKTPLVQKAQVKAAEPPTGLPVELVGAVEVPHTPTEGTATPTEAKPAKKLFTTDSGEVIEYEDHF